MSHYDCSDCGYSMGISYGLCENCAPEIVTKLKLELESAIQKAEYKFDKMFGKQKEKFIKSKIGKLEKKYKEVYDKNHPNKERKSNKEAV